VLDRIDNKEITGFTSSHVLGEAVHRLMTIEACQRFGWPAKGIAQRLRRHPAEIQQLLRARQAVDEITLIGLDVLPVAKSDASLAVDLNHQTRVALRGWVNSGNHANPRLESPRQH